MRERAQMAPSLAASALLHGGVLVAALVSWPWLSKPIQMGASVPVTIVAEAPVTNVRPAEQAPVEQTAQTEDPVPDAPVETVAPPQPEPTPAPPKAAPPPPPKPAPQPTPKKPPPPQKKQQEESFDLDALAASIKPKGGGKPKSSAPKGANRPETSVDARPAAGAATGLAANALASIGADLERRWNPNCAVEGGADVNLTVQVVLTAQGRVVGRPQVIRGMKADAVTQAAATRAIAAIRQAEPFESVPPEFAGEKLNLNFNARRACS